MTAGRSIYHQEMPHASGHLKGTQLWLNLPRAQKMTAPAYRDITAKDLKIFEDEQTYVKVIAGTFRGKKGPVKGTYVDPLYFDVSIRPKGIFETGIPAENTVFLFMLNGSIQFEDGGSAEFPEVRGVLLSHGERISILSEKGARYLLIAGRPLQEPIAWGGPIVMNSQEELREAFAEIRNGTFVQD